jgi:hypothetical protein
MSYVDRLESSGAIDAATAAKKTSGATGGADEGPTDEQRRTWEHNAAILRRQYNDKRDQLKAIPPASENASRRAALQKEMDELKRPLDAYTSALAKMAIKAVPQPSAPQSAPKTAPVGRDAAAQVALHLTQAGVPPTVAADVAPIITHAQASGGQLDLQALAQAAGSKENFIKIAVALGIGQ